MEKGSMNRKMRRAMKKAGASSTAAPPPTVAAPAAAAVTPALAEAARVLSSDPDRALALAQAVTASEPDNKQAWLIVAFARRSRHEIAAAVEAFGVAVQLDPTDPLAVRNFADALFAAGDSTGAAEASIAAANLQPDNPAVVHDAGLRLRAVHRFEEAEACLRRTLEITGDNLAVLNNLGLTLHDLGRYGEAIEVYLKALRLHPDEADLLFNIGNVYRALGRHGDALSIYQRCLAAAPQHVGALTNLGLALKSLNRVDEAQAAFRRALEIKPDHLTARNNLAASKVHTEQVGEAVELLEKLVAEQADNVGAMSNLGKAYIRNDRYGDAADVLCRALATIAGDPGRAPALRAALRPDGRLDPSFFETVEALPGSDAMVTAVTAFAGVLATNALFDDAFALMRRVMERSGATNRFTDFLMFYANYHPAMTAEEIYSVYLASAELLEQEVRSQGPLPAPAVVAAGEDPERRLRVGFASPDLRSHSVANFVEAVFANLDRDRIEPVAFAELRQPDMVTERLRTHFASWFHTDGLSDAEMGDLIRRERIDILVDVAGHTGGNRLRALARRPAPVQATWLGYGYTTGLPWIDYFISDSCTAGPDAWPVVREAVAALRPFAATFSLKRAAPDLSPLPALTRGHVTFGSLTRPVRVNDRTLDVWARLLQAVPGSRLRLDSRSFGDGFVRDLFLTRFAMRGIGAERLDIGFTPGGAMPIYAEIDITLDCFPHNSGTTLFESLYMGVPYVSLADRPTVGRLGGAILTGLGRPEWIAWNEQEYVTKVADLAADLPRLAALRAGLRAEMQASRLMDGAAVARDMEQALRTMWRRACAGQPPASFVVE